MNFFCFLFATLPRNCCSSFPKGKIVDLWQLNTPLIPQLPPFLQVTMLGPQVKGEETYVYAVAAASQP